MTARSKGREIALQTLYLMDMHNQGSNQTKTTALTSTAIGWQEAVNSYLDHWLSTDLEREGASVEFATRCVLGVTSNKAFLDELINHHTRKWKLNRLGVIDRNILRLGAYELCFTDVPSKVALNEAVELTKKFSGDDASGFINGILDAIMRDKRGNESL